MENPRNVLRFDRACVYGAAEWNCGVFGEYVLCIAPIAVISMIWNYSVFLFQSTHCEPMNAPGVPLVAYCYF